MLQDQEIIKLYWARNEEAIRESERKYGSYCHAIAHQILNSTEDAGECVNDTWWRAWNAIPPVRPRCLQAFFAKITRNISFDLWRKQRASRRGGGEMALVLDELLQCIPYEKSPETQMMERVDEAELGQCINGFLETLSSRDRSIFVRRYWLAEAAADIARRYGMKENTVRGSLFRSRRDLRAYLESEGIDL